jgi:phosphoribosylglycinamide formyltransferase-1
LNKQRCQAAILISGSGTNLQSFIDRVASGDLDLDIALVFSNKPDAYGLTRAANAGLPTVCIEHSAYPDRESFDRAIAAVLEPYAPDLIILAGFMRILSPWFVQQFAGRILNIHPALLPLYPGLNTHARALEAGDSHHGSTVHFVTEELDGGPRILAGRLAINRGETAAELEKRVQALEHRIYPQAAGLFASGRIAYRDGQVLLDGTVMHDPIIENFPIGA